jgi:hypothetical protein
MPRSSALVKDHDLGKGRYLIKELIQTKTLSLEPGSARSETNVIL